MGIIKQLPVRKVLPLASRMLYGITKRFLSGENSLKASGEIRQIVENAPVAMAAVSLPRGDILYINKKCTELSGYTREDVPDVEQWLLLAHPDEGYRNKMREEWLRIIASLVSGEKSIDRMEGEVVCKDGSAHSVEMLASLSGSKVFVSFFDLTERIKAEEALRNSEQELLRIIEHSPVAMAIVGLHDKKVLYINRKAREISGYTFENIRDIESWWENAHPDKSERELARSEFLGKMYNIMQGVKDSDYIESTISGKGGRKFNAVTWFTVVRDKIFLTFIDMTDIKKAEEERRIMSQRMIHFEKMDSLGRLAGGIAHDFNNLLMGIQGHISLMKLDLGQDNRFRHRMETIEEQVQSGAKLTQQLLGFARGGKYEVRPTDINKFIKKHLELYGRAQKGIKIELVLAHDLKKADVDRGQMDQVLLNILVNAGHAMAGVGNLRIETMNVHFAEEEAKKENIAPGDYISIAVTDDGCGMDNATKSRIFEPFFTTKKIGEGTGMGLASAYGIVNNHGGLICVDSEAGKGSTFSIYLPVSKMNYPDKTAFPSQNIIHGGNTILLVDDEDLVRDVAGEMLRALGYKVCTAATGSEAIAKYKDMHGDIDLVILDMIMPGIGGDKVFDAMRAVDPDVKIILASGYSMNGNIQALMEKGCTGFLQKPFNMRDLSAKVAETLEE
jgi:two-component system cell cycle sensor histidine kinase/response regulator CckA